MSDQKLVLPITGMTCANCSGTIERNLKRMPGVSDATVNLATERATVSYDNAVVGPGEITGLVEELGYGVATAKADLPIAGMTCANCSATIERNLNRMPGVDTAVVNLATERAAITYNPAMVDVRAMKDLVSELGYEVIELDGMDEEEMVDAERAARLAETERQRHLLIVGLAFTIPLFLLSMARDFRPDRTLGACVLGELADVGVGHAGAVLCGQRLLRQRLQSPEKWRGQHGRAHRHGFIRGLLLQRGRHPRRSGRAEFRRSRLF